MKPLSKHRGQFNSGQHKHKITEAIKNKKENGFDTLCFHVDLYDGRGGCFSITEFGKDAKLESRGQMEGQTVASIEKMLTWKLTDNPLDNAKLISAFGELQK